MKAKGCLQINLLRILENYRAFSAAAKPDVWMAAVVKDNAYGLGAVQVANVLYRTGNCFTFFVAHAFEGHEVRAVAPKAAIYVLQGPDEDCMDFFIKDNLIPVISSPMQLDFWNQAAPQSHPVALMIETGLNRLGFREAELLALSPKERNRFHLVLSHLACADEPNHPMNEKQLSTFQKLTALFPKAKFSLSASDGFLLGEKYHFDVVRLGAVLYGINPIKDAEIQSRNVIRLTAPVIQVAKVNAGDFIGYGAAYQVKEKGKIAIVSIGYGDGVFRSFFPNGKVWFEKEGERFAAPLVGRVSMDNLICDVSHIPKEVLSACPEAVLVDDAYTVDDFGADAGTIGYEALSALGHGIRFKREYIK